MQKHSLSVVVTAYNEEKTIANAVRDTDNALLKYGGDYEIIVVNDASMDKTREILDALPKNDRWRVVHNAVNHNTGYNMRLGVSMANKEYCLCFVNADTYPSEETFRELFSAIGEKDVVLGCLAGYGRDRTWMRRFLSWTFVKVMNVLFCLHIRYYNGPVIVKTSVWRTVPMTTNGFAYMAEVVATLLKRRMSYVEIPVVLSPERKGVNVAVLRRNFLNVAGTLASLFWRLNVKKELYVRENS